ncbi:AAA family ATPase [Nocardia cyriacigeorgica]|uniref:AAA family ATPase n=1 Tax=Nocardia cyriacigeorgica TaxID=135487 RepID=UPI001895C903|nr:AAA family ATPase [Nocardia cyriacigeorgica]MBF6428678.1 AAA family ATPase [Nocardia cyriacigeorgica]
MSRVETIQDYLSRGWVPFLYESGFSPPGNWQNSTSGNFPVEAAANSTNPIGLLLGKPSGIVVVDIDVQNGGSAEKLFKRYGQENLKNTRVVKTPSGGWHLYFRYPDVEYLKGVINAGKNLPDIGLGIDLLADGRHVQAPPTVRINHPTKPDGEYSVIVDEPPAELPEKLLRDWLSLTADKHTGTTTVDSVSPLQYQRLMDVHLNNLNAAKNAVPGELDNTFFSKLCSSMRISRVLPDEVLSLDAVETAYRDMPYDVRDLSGKLDRAREFAEAHPWDEMSLAEITDDIPDEIAPEDAWEYMRQLRQRRVSLAVQDTIKRERIEREASLVVLPEYEQGDIFLGESLPDEDWVIEGLLHNQGKALLSAQMKAGKSTMMLELIRALTTGTPFLGRFRVPHPLKVVFYDMELGRVMAHRWLGDVPLNQDRLQYVNLLGKGNAVDMRSEGLRTNTARRMREIKADVLIVDPISPVLSALGVTENDSESIRPLLDSFDQLAVEAGLKSVVITAHTGHENKDRARGSAAFGDWPTALWNMQKHGDEQDSPRTFAAHGRDVNVPRSDLVFDQTTRGYRLV